MTHSIFRHFKIGSAAARQEPEEPIRSELFGLDRLEQHAESLAAAQQVTRKVGAGRPLAPRLRENERVLLAAYRTIGKAIREERAITPAAEWLVDNFHIVEEQIREIRDDLPQGYYRQLPKLVDGPLAGYPRVFGLAWAFVAHTDSLFEPQTLCRFVRAYQRVQPLTIGELWAVAITLRIVLVENLRRAADRIVSSRAARQAADSLSDRLLGVGAATDGAGTTSIPDFEPAALPRAFAVQLVQRLRDQDPAVTPVLRWLEERLAAQGTTADEVVAEEHQKQGAMNVTVRNVITSMRLMSAVDWSEFFESVSLVDASLCAGSDFAAMDFATRDQYRHAIEELARGSKLTELDVAQRALAATRWDAGAPIAASASVLEQARQDPGFHLLAKGRRAFEKELGFRVPLKQWLPRLYLASGMLGYLGVIALLTGVLVWLAVWAVVATGTGGAVSYLLALLALSPASTAAVALVNRHVTNHLGATLLPALELSGGVPPSLRTLLVVPMLLTSKEAIEESIERLEVHYLSSPDEGLHFALLSDWIDAASESTPEDAAVLAAAAAGVQRLNQRYPMPESQDRFLLLHRRRLWSGGEGKWIGWERKRGKLHELNRLLRGATDTSFLALGGRPLRVPTDVRFVITLDADTRLPRGVARRLVGKLAHPLNRPLFDARSQRVVHGHGVLQPRVTPMLPLGRDGSLFQRIFSGPGGMDPYAAAVSDVYQDLLGEGSYTGKGIYDVDAFEAALAGRVPEGTLLSHDLLEGIFARAGLVTDVEVVEEFPARYDVAAARQHRWARGDWQLLPWIFGRGFDRRAAVVRAIPWTGRWKMLDNLRRTLAAPAAFLALLVGWLLPLPAAAVWTSVVVAFLVLPSLLPFLAGIVPRRVGISKRSHARAVGIDLQLAVSQSAFELMLLAHQAWMMVDAVLRTLYRVGVSRRNLLEWLTAAQAKFGLPLDVPGFYRRMAGSVAVVVVVGLGVAYAALAAWPVAVPWLALWALAPWIAQCASRPPPLAGAPSVSPADADALRPIARRTWRFFETFVGASDHMLPPDNFQEQPHPVLAHRTSPTNLGLYLLSVVTARDFGWIGTAETTDRLTATLTTMQGLERFRGHFFNWYDTRDLRTLEPKYISSVDSGNLAGHLIALGNACRRMHDEPVLHRQRLAGIEDALRLARSGVERLGDTPRPQTVSSRQLQETIESLASTLGQAPTSAVGTVRQLRQLLVLADTLVDIAQTLVAETGSLGTTAGFSEVSTWALAVRASIASHLRDSETLLPWLRLALVAGTPGDARDCEAGVFPNSVVATCFATMPTIADLPGRCATASAALIQQRAEWASRADGSAAAGSTLDAWLAALAQSAAAAKDLGLRLDAIAAQSAAMFEAMEFGFLLDPARQLLSIGYQVAEGQLDPSCYDLLASEARLASFVAIAKGDVPARHWFRLGRSLTPVDHGSALISWSGSMFEYLMPALVMRAPAGSLLEQTSRFIVRRQVTYGSHLGVPWGVSESAYNVRDLEFTYQYSNFGVPGLGLKRGLSEDAVIAPYATALAAMVDPHAAQLNFQRLAAVGALGPFGYYEALDYTPSRIPEGESVAIVRCYMAHHQGMTLLALANALHGGAMRDRFHAEPIVQATELLLQERTPRDVAVARPRAEEVKVAANVRDPVPFPLRRYLSPHDSPPRTHLLSNGRYSVMITAAGAGYSRWRDTAVTRWHEDRTRDAWGSFVFLRDVRSGEVWSAGFQPTGIEPDDYEVEFPEDRAHIVRRDGSLTTTLEVAVSPESDAEVRRVSIANLGHRMREIELTSFAELVLAPAVADAAHPAFSKLFVHTEYVEDVCTLLATRRRRAPTDPEIWAAHLAVVEGESVGEVQFETDRARFLGRGCGPSTPISIVDGRPLSGTVGMVLDPIFSLRCRVRIPPRSTVRVAFWTLVAPTRAEALDLADKHQDTAAYDRVVTLAWTQAQVQLHHLGCTPDEAYLFQRLANYVLYSSPTLRPSAALLLRNERGPSTLWPHAISGDLPIVLVRIDDAGDAEIVRQILRAHHYWRSKMLSVDLVILNERPVSYAQDLQSSLETLLRTSLSHARAEGQCGQGGVHLLRADQVSVEVRTVLQCAARVVLLSRRGSLSEQLHHLEEEAAAARSASLPSSSRLSLPVRVRQVVRATANPVALPVAPPKPALEYFNGLGGFAADGREYVTVLGEGQWTPAPWINVVANRCFGFQVSVEGGGYTWSGNSREHQLTPWSNDPVADCPGEALYVRDEDSGAIWCPTAMPIRNQRGSYVARHGQGYSRFEHTEHGIGLELLQFVPLSDSLKISRLTLRNHSTQTRRLSVTAYVEWVLAQSRATSAHFLVTESDPESGVLLVRNPWSREPGARVAFIDLGGKQTACSGDRTEFIGRNGSLAMPAALNGRTTLSNHVGAGLDPCGVLQAPVTLEPNGTTEVVFFLGEAASREEAVALALRYRTLDLDAVLREVSEHWDGILGAVQVQTPDRALDLMLNRWLLYQTLVCRVLARSAFYQASGAYGFRDQLQDGMALAVVQPQLTREHLLRAASRQFVEGDVQHWWLPSSGQGVRTRISDDRVWLAHVVEQYVRVSGDAAVLDVEVAYLEGPTLRAGEHDSFFQPMIAEERGTLFEHCVRALDGALAVGVHGLPLIGTGDWNDGMNRVGEAGAGESVWLGWFLHTTLTSFAALAEARGDAPHATAWRSHATALLRALEAEAWDGKWYRRGYFDDGTPLGSATSDECRIDSIAQSWSVMSGAADPLRAAQAMAAVDEQLVRREDGLVLLFTPPFDKTALDPGYIKGYPPGIRENGGQYTHAAAWSVIAFAMLGDGDRAAELFAMLNPIRHADSRTASYRYKVEPYVATADVYSEAPHVGRGGWTWYTGSAGWLYRAGLEWILGLRVEGATLRLAPCIPRSWPGYEMRFRYGTSLYVITVENPHGASRGIASIEVDGRLLAPHSESISLVADAATHAVRVVLGETDDRR